MPLLAAGAGIGAAVLLHFRDPHQEGSYGICPFYALTGWWCPGCGGMRAVHNLTDGRVLDAIHSNIIALPLVLVFAIWVGSWIVRSWQDKPIPVVTIPKPTLWVFLAFVAAFTVLRNTPWGTWLAPV
ncbi:DUF2752 domain-containing protein [Nocardia sp. NPDC052566]|uniref:DUF2752 domain-containing protein n=1 Tax=Nocardia sp. NPDC052566 TaxID=3364330 RepID=UPI0037CC70C1